MVDYYAALEVDPNASPEEIKRSYRRLALRYHPDKAGPEGSTRFREINAAYEVLSDERKKDIYDRYGDAGLAALDNPVASGALRTLGGVVLLAIVVGIALISTIMVLLFLIFLACFVDGLLPTLNYVKVFAPLFVVDVIVGVPALLLFFIFIVTKPGCLAVHFMHLALFCAIVLSIIIPVVKDRNEERARNGRTDLLKWRQWLVPGYLFSVFLFLVEFLISVPTEKQSSRPWSLGLVHLARYYNVRFVIRLLQGACVVVLVALVACRADKVITVDYFVVIGLPIFLLLTLHLVNIFWLQLLRGYVSEVPPEEAAQQPGAHGDAMPPPQSPADDMERRESLNPMSSGSAQGVNPPLLQGDDAAPAQSTGHPEHTDHDRREDEPNASQRANMDDQRTKRPCPGRYTSVCGVLLQMIFLIIEAGLLVASTAMVAVRLNYFYNHNTYVGVLSLRQACIPLFILAGSIVVAELFTVLSIFFPSGTIPDGTQQQREHGNQTEVDQANAAAAEEPGTNTQETAPGNAPNVSSPDRYFESPIPPAPASDSAHVSSTLPNRMPDHDRISDVD